MQATRLRRVLELAFQEVTSLPVRHPSRDAAAWRSAGSSISGVPRLGSPWSNATGRAHAVAALAWPLPGLPSAPSLAIPAQPHGAREFAIHKSRRKDAQASAPEPPRVDLRKNAEITAAIVRLVDGDSHSVVSLGEALQRATWRGLDLVEVAANANPPVCRIMDFRALEQGAVKVQSDLEEKKRLVARDAAKNKEIRVGCHITQHDLEIKLRKIRDLLEKGNRVTVSATYEFRRSMWREEYPKAIQVAKRVWELYSSEFHSWFDYAASGNKQISIVFSTSKAPKNLADPFPWEAGSMPPPFMIKMQQEAEAAAEQDAAARNGVAPPSPVRERGTGTRPGSRRSF